MTLNGQGATCSFTLSSGSTQFATPGGPGSVSVSAASGCSWTAVSNVPWITITAGSSGSGNGTVSYTVAANTSTTSRTGTLTIAGQTVTVTQAEALPSPRLCVDPTDIDFGLVQLGDTVSETLTITNCGGGSLIGSAAFVQTEGDLTLASTRDFCLPAFH